MCLKFVNIKTSERINRITAKIKWSQAFNIPIQAVYKRQSGRVRECEVDARVGAGRDRETIERNAVFIRLQQNHWNQNWKELKWNGKKRKRKRRGQPTKRNIQFFLPVCASPAHTLTIQQMPVYAHKNSNYRHSHAHIHTHTCRYTSKLYYINIHNDYSSFILVSFGIFAHSLPLLLVHSVK